MWNQGNARIVVILIILVVLVGIGWFVFSTTETETPDNGQEGTTTTDRSNSDGESEMKNLTVTESEITRGGETLLTIDEFADGIRVSEDAVFGGSERIDGAKLSPTGEWVAISVSGAAHSFGWIYTIETDTLEPVVFQYGGSVTVKEWQDDERVAFTVETPQPETNEEVIDVTDMPEYPQIATGTSATSEQQ